MFALSSAPCSVASIGVATGGRRDILEYGGTSRSAGAITASYEVQHPDPGSVLPFLWRHGVVGATFTKVSVSGRSPGLVDGAGAPVPCLAPGVYGVEQVPGWPASFEFQVTQEGFVEYAAVQVG